MTLSPEELGHIVRERRLAANLSAERLAAATNMTTGTISRLERGEIRDPGYRLLSRIALVLKAPGADALVGQPVVSELDLLEPYYEGRARRPAGVKPLEAKLQAAIHLEEQAAPSSSKPSRELRQARPGQPGEAPRSLPRMAGPGTHKRGK